MGKLRLIISRGLNTDRFRGEDIVCNRHPKERFKMLDSLIIKNFIAMRIQSSFEHSFNNYLFNIYYAQVVCEVLRIQMMNRTEMAHLSPPPSMGGIPAYKLVEFLHINVVTF